MIGQLTSTINAQAVATLLTGIAAVLGALLIGHRQLELRRNEVRIALLEQRREVLKRFRTLMSEWQVGANLRHERMHELIQLVRDVELLFEESTRREAEKILHDTTFQSMFARHSEMYSASGDEKRRMKAVENEQDRLEQIAERLPQLEALLVKATKVGHLFR